MMTTETKTPYDMLQDVNSETGITMAGFAISFDLMFPADDKDVEILKENLEFLGHFVG